MAETFLSYVSNIFYDVADKKQEDIHFTLSRKYDFPLLISAPTLEVILPLPKILNQEYFFEGFTFADSEDSRQSMWSLLIASVYHLAAHIVVSDYSLYNEWMKNKSQDVCWRVIDFIEDAFVSKYLSSTNTQTWNGIRQLEDSLTSTYKKQNSELNHKKLFSEFYIQYNIGKIEKIIEHMVNARSEGDHAKRVIEYAEMLYKNRMLLPQHVLPYCEFRNLKNMNKINSKIIDFKMPSVFNKVSHDLDELWQRDVRRHSKMIARCQKHIHDLNFDEIIIPEQDMNSYLKIKSENSMMIRKVKNQIRTVNNTVDDPRAEELGAVDMQAAIQAIAADKKFNIFEQEFSRRREESWVILVDNSASIKLKFDKIKDLLVSLSESADELTGMDGMWSLYSFDNKFSILKDFDEKYSDEVKGRIGGLKNGGLSFIPDAIELAGRLLAEDPGERKYIFVFTDAYPSGYENINQQFQNTLKKLDKLGIKVIGIGLSDNIMKFFKIHCTGDDLRETVAKFITAYRHAAAQYL